jgi:hypothetical protein
MQDTITLAGIDFRPSEIRAHWDSGARAIAKEAGAGLMQPGPARDAELADAAVLRAK